LSGGDWILTPEHFVLRYRGGGEEEKKRKREDKKKKKEKKRKEKGRASRLSPLWLYVDNFFG
jgi:hypothetical protein